MSCLVSPQSKKVHPRLVNHSLRGMPVCISSRIALRNASYFHIGVCFWVPRPYQVHLNVVDGQDLFALSGLWLPQNSGAAYIT